MLKIRFGNTKSFGGRLSSGVLLLGIAQLGLSAANPVAHAQSIVDAEPAWASAPTALPDSQPTIVLAQADESEDRIESRPLEPRYEPFEPEEKSWYNSGYLFGMTRGVADSTIAPAGKVPLFFLTVPLDIVFLPFAAIGGLFG